MGTTASVSNLKARLSASLDIVRRGGEVLVTDRGRIIARLAPVAGALLGESRRDLLIRSGSLRPPVAPLTADVWNARCPLDPEGRSLAALLDERLGAAAEREGLATL